MIHVYPLNDLKEHLLEGTTCECEPNIIAEPDKDMIVVHNSFDGREGVEIANDLLGLPQPILGDKKGWNSKI